MEYYLKRAGNFIQEHIVIIAVGLALSMTAFSVVMAPKSRIMALIPVAVMLLLTIGVMVLRNRALIVLGILVFNENFIYMFNRFLLVYVYDLRQLLGVIFFGLFILYLPRILRTKMLFKSQMLLLMAYFMMELTVAYIHIGQNYIQGFYTLYFNFLLLGYFIISFIWQDMDTYNRFQRYLIYYSIVSGLLFILQSRLYPRIIFMLTDFRYRYGNVRFTEFSVLMTLVMFMTINIVIENKKLSMTERVIHYTALVIQLYTLVLIAQNRLNLGVAVFIIALAFWFWQSRFSRRQMVIVGIFGLVGLVALIYKMGIFSGSGDGNVITETLEEITNVSGNLGIRYNAANFYIKNLSGHWLLGYGSLNLNLPQAIWLTGRKFLYYMVDVGIIGFVYKFGLIGLVLTFALMIRGLVIARRVYRMDHHIYYPMMGQLFFILMSPQVFYYQEAAGIFYLGLWLAIIEFHYKHLERRASHEDTHDNTLSDLSDGSGEQTTY